MISFSRYFTVCITYQPPLVYSKLLFGWYKSRKNEKICVLGDAE